MQLFGIQNQALSKHRLNIQKTTTISSVCKQTYNKMTIHQNSQSASEKKLHGFMWVATMDYVSAKGCYTEHSIHAQTIHHTTWTFLQLQLADATAVLSLALY